MKIKELFPEGKMPPSVPGEIPLLLILKGIDLLNEVSCIVELFTDFCELMAVTYWLSCYLFSQRAPFA